MAIALTDTADQRRRIYASLTRRNSTIGVLRLLVPGIGVVIFALLAGGVLIANLAENFSIGRITLQSDRMVVDTPAYSGVTGDGTTYQVSALSAETGLSSTEAVTLNGAKVVINAPSGIQTTAEASRAVLRTVDQQVAVEGITVLSNSAGMEGTLHGMDLDFPKGTVSAKHGVDFTFPGGEHLTATHMDYDGSKTLWSFTGVVLTLPSAPKAMAK